MKKKSKGFTLVELLAVIVILAVILVITIPTVLKAANAAKKESFFLYAQSLQSKAIAQYTQDLEQDKEKTDCAVYSIEDDLHLSDTGKFQGWVQVKRTPVSSGKNNVEVTLNDSRGLEYVKYCVAKGNSCTPTDTYQVEDGAKTVTIFKAVSEGYVLCANYQYADNKTLKQGATKCMTYANGTAAHDTYDYELKISLIDDSYAADNVAFNKDMSMEAFYGKMKKGTSLTIVEPICSASGVAKTITRGQTGVGTTYVKESTQKGTSVVTVNSTTKTTGVTNVNTTTKKTDTVVNVTSSTKTTTNVIVGTTTRTTSNVIVGTTTRTTSNVIVGTTTKTTQRTNVNTTTKTTKNTKVTSSTKASASTKTVNSTTKTTKKTNVNTTTKTTKNTKVTSSTKASASTKTVNSTTKTTKKTNVNTTTKTTKNTKVTSTTTDKNANTTKVTSTTTDKNANKTSVTSSTRPGDIVTNVTTTTKTTTNSIVGTTTTTTSNVLVSTVTTTTRTTYLATTTVDPLDTSLQLAHLEIVGYDIGFSPLKYYYDLDVPYTVDKVKVNVTGTAPETQITVSGAENIVVGANPVVIQLFNTLTGERSFYRVYVYKAPKPGQNVNITTKDPYAGWDPDSGIPDPTLAESDASLTHLSVAGYVFGFNPDVYDYTLETYGEDTLQLYTRTASKKAIVNINGNENLEDGSQIVIMVQSPNGYYHKTYTINVKFKNTTSTTTKVLRGVALGIAVVAAAAAFAVNFVKKRKTAIVQNDDVITPNNQGN